MKQVVINVDKSGYGVASLGDDLNALPEDFETGIMLAAAIDRMKKSGYSKELITEIVDDVYKRCL